MAGWLVSLVLLAGIAPTQDRGRVRDASRGASSRRVIREEITPQLRISVHKGLKWLVAEQTRTLSFTTSEFPVAANALTGLALLTGGFTDRSGPQDWTAALDDVTRTILSFQQNSSGYIDDGDRGRMYGHGFATLFLAQLYGMSHGDHERIRDALERAVRLIERSQTKEGAWDYVPWTEGFRANGGDTSIAVCQTMALRAASNLGIPVDTTVRSRAKRFIERAQRSNGSFRYRMSGPPLIGVSPFPRSAAGVCILYSLGDYSSSRLRSGVIYLQKNYRYTGAFPHYAQYYCAQAFFQVGGSAWKEYFPWVRERLIRYQDKKDGFWPASKSEPSAVVRTAMALIVLQLPYRFLPIHER